MKKILLTLLSFGSLFTSCRKADVKPEINVQTVSGNYTLKGLRMSATGIPEQDAFSTVPACAADDLYKLKPDNSFEYDDAGVICDSASTRYEGTWTLDGDHISFYGESGVITKFDGTTLEVTTTSSDPDKVYVTRSTYEKE